MKVTAPYLYPDFSSKRKYNSFCTKKSVKKEEQSFEECMKSISMEIDKRNNNTRKKYNI